MKILNVLVLLLLFHALGWSKGSVYPAISKSNGKAKFQKLGDLLGELKSVFKVEITYDAKTTEETRVSNRRINRKLNLEDNLIQLLGPLGLRCEKTNATSYTIIVKHKRTPSENSIERYLTSDGPLNSALPSKKARKTVTGIVYDVETNEAIIGVTVLLKGTAEGTITDINGKFLIEVLDEKSVLVFSFVGYDSYNVIVGDGNEIKVAMKRGSKSLGEVVVVGYGSQKKSDITGSVSSVPMKDIEKQPSSRIDQSLQGRVSGIVVQNTDASPNAQVSIRIRGSNSINGGNDPLVVVDGMQGGNLSIINPNDVASVEVLKDASATAIYGSRGANGVIIVTTKQGRTGKPAISYNSYYSLTQIRKKLDQLDAPEYAQTVNENRAEFGLPLVFTTADVANFQKNGGTDWQDVIFRHGFIQNHQLSLSGAGENLKYYISGNAMNHKGLVEGSSYKRYTLRTNLKALINEKVSVGLNALLARELNHPTALNSFVGSNSGSPIFSALVWAPTKPVYDSQGSYTQPGGGYGPNTNYNPLALAIEPVRDYLTTTSNVTGNINYEIIKGLNLSVLGSYRGSENENSDYFNSKPTGASGTEMAYISNQRTFFLQNTNMLTYEKQIRLHHNIKFTGVVEQQNEVVNGNFAGALGFSTNVLNYNNLSLGTSPQISTSFRHIRSLLSYLGRVNYDFKEKYLLTLTLRADGSSVFGANNKWGQFPSAALGWNLMKEPFMANLNHFLSDLKLRASYGIVGNQAINPYQTLASLNTNLMYPVNGTSLSTGVGSDGLANPDLKWEKTRQTDIGIDAYFLDGRVEVVADYYNKQTTDLLLAVPTPLAAGGKGSVLKNVGSVENKGFELYLGGTPMKGNFIWKTRFTFALNRNKVIALADHQNEILLGNPGLPGFANTLWLQVGEPLGVFRGYSYDGVWKSSEIEQAKKYGASPGDAKYVDQNNDGAIDSKDIVNIGNAQPGFSLGWNNSLSFRGFDLNVFLQGVQGNSIYNLSRVRFETGDATSRAILNRWKPGDENTNIPSFKGSNDGRLNSSRWLEDGSYIRLKNISVGYTFPKSSLNVIGVNQLRIYASASNWLTFTSYSGFDPESSSGVDTHAGVDLATYPSQKTITIGLDIKL